MPTDATRTTPACTHPACDNPSPDAFLCRNCADRLRTDLREVPDLVSELLVTMCRWDEPGEVPGRGTARRAWDDDPSELLEPTIGSPLPYRPPAAECGRALHAEVSTAARMLIERRYGPELDVWVRERDARAAGALGPWRRGPQLPPDDVAELALWLARHMETIRQDPAAGDIAAGVHRRVEQARAVVHPAGVEYMGPCVCAPLFCQCGRPERCQGRHAEQVDLYVPRGASVVTCHRCGASWPTEDRRQWLAERARGQLLTATEAARVLPALLAEVLPKGKRLTASAIRGMAHRNRLQQRPPHPMDGSRAPRYEVGELIDLVHTMRRRELAGRGRTGAKAGTATGAP